MAKHIAIEAFTKELFEILDETFEQVHGIYLDKGTSLFETLETITAAEASRPVSASCACIAAQVEHVRFYLHVLGEYMQNKPVGKVDWSVSWQLKAVTPAQWDTLKQQLRATYQHILTVINGFDSWQGENDLAGSLAVLVHTAYHLGEIRQALCTIKAATSL
jgi:hypothetical protein